MTWSYSAMGKQEGRRLDRYYTPAYATNYLAHKLERNDLLDGSHVIVDPCCGEGHILEVMANRGYATAGGDIVLAEAAPDEMLQADATIAELSAYTAEALAAVITNPPYFADTGTAGEVLTNVVTWGVPTWALVSSRFTADPAQDRRALLYGSAQPDLVINLGRTEFEGPDLDEGSSGSFALSQWVGWNLECGWDGTRLDWATPVELDHARGQADLFAERAE